MLVNTLSLLLVMLYVLTLATWLLIVHDLARLAALTALVTAIGAVVAGWPR